MKLMESDDTFTTGGGGGGFTKIALIRMKVYVKGGNETADCDGHNEGK